MSGAVETIKSFLVNLGFKIDDSGMKRFARSIAIQTEVVHELADGLKETAIKIVDFARGISEATDELYFTSQRVKASVANLQALQYAATQSGVSVDSMSAALENLNKFLVTNPMGEALLNSKLLHVATRDSNGRLRDTADILRDVKHSLSEMQPYLANRYASMFGIDWKLLNASAGSIDKFTAEYKAMAQSMGLDADKAAGSGNKFQTTMRRLRGWLDLLAEKAGSELADRLQEPLDRLSRWLIGHGPEIGKLIDRIIDGFERMVPVLLRFGKFAADALGGLLHWFNNLPAPVKAFLGVLLALIPVAAALAAGVLALGAAITALGTIFGVLAAAVDIALGPIGLISAAIGALILDFERWKTTGKSFLPWDKWKPEIDAAVAGVQGFAKTVRDKLGLGAGAAAPTVASDQSTRGLRNNNPGNIEYGRWAKTHGAAGAEAAGRFAVFQSAQDGLDALAALLQGYAAKGLNTVRSIISKYAPASDGNPSSYMATVAKRLGVGMDSALNLSDRNVLATLMRSIVQFENGKNPYSNDMLALAAAHAGVAPAGGANVVIHQTNTTTVTGSSDPKAAGRQVGRAQDFVNQRLMRNLQARVS